MASVVATDGFVAAGLHHDRITARIAHHVVGLLEVESDTLPGLRQIVTDRVVAEGGLAQGKRKVARRG